jgi:hypothetical protein
MAPAGAELLRTPAGTWLGALPGGSTFYASLDLDSSREALGSLLGGAGVRETTYRAFLDRTSRLYAAVTLLPGAPPEFATLAIGRFPQGPTNLSLLTNREWKKRRESRLYWQHRQVRLQIAVPRDNLILASSGPVVPLADRLQTAPPLALPPEAAAEMEAAALVVFFPRLPPEVEREWGHRAPVRDLWLSARPVGPGGADRPAGPAYELLAVFGLTEVRNPRLVESLFRLLITVWLRGARLDNLSERLKTVQVAAGTDAVRVSGLSLTLEELLRALQALAAGGAEGRGDSAAVRVPSGARGMPKVPARGEGGAPAGGSDG